MISPLELMARAAWRGRIPWEKAPAAKREEAIASMRDALLAASDMPMPMSVVARVEGRLPIRTKISNALQAIADSR